MTYTRIFLKTTEILSCLIRLFLKSSSIVFIICQTKTTTRGRREFFKKKNLHEIKLANTICQ